MANRYDWNAVQAREAEQEARAAQNGKYVGYFSLKNDKDEAIVRIMHDTPDDFDFVPVHPATIAGKFANVGCLRGPNDPLDMCPMCEAGNRFSLRMYIHLIQYTTDEQGQVVAQAKVWDRSSSYARTLVNFMNEYGPLSDMLFKIKRNGKAGSTDTTYDIMPASTKIYTEDRYVKDTSLFEDYTALGNAVKVKTFEEMMQVAAENPAQAPAQQTTSYAPKATAPAFSAPTYNTAPKAAAPAYNAPVANAEPVNEQPIMPEAQRPTYNVPNTARPAFQGTESTQGAKPRRYW